MRKKKRNRENKRSLKQKNNEKKIIYMYIYYLV